MAYSSNNMYGVLNSQMTHTDVSNTERGAKNYATRNGYDKVSVRFNLGYHVEFISKKVGNKWVSPDYERRNVPSNSIYLKDGKTLSAYGLLCGYIHNNKKEGKVEYLGKGYKELYFDSVYHVRTSRESGDIWESFETLTEAKKFYKSIKL